MKTRLISLGLCEKYDLENQTRILNIFQINSYFKNVLFHFRINSEKKEDCFAFNYQYRSYQEQIFKLLPQGGFFNPSTVTTEFYENSENIKENRIIERQPAFFVLLMPYPMLKYFNSHYTYGTSEWASNPSPFMKQRFDGKLSRNDRFSDFRLETDLTGEIKIENVLRKYDFYNNFFTNNNFPYFIEDHDELMTLINDLDGFYFNTLGFNLKLENLSKIIIPFFELTSIEASELSSSKSDDLPF